MYSGSMRSRRCIPTLIVLAWALAFAPAFAAELDDLVGEWFVGLLIPESPQTGSLNVMKIDTGLKATLISPLGEITVDEIELEDGKHTLLYMMQVGDQRTDLEITVEVKGDTFSGEVIVGGGAVFLDIEGARSGTEAEKTLIKKVEEMEARADEVQGVQKPLLLVEAAPFVGAWTLILDLSGQPIKSQFTIFELKDETGKQGTGIARALFEIPKPFYQKIKIKHIQRTGDGLKMKFDLKLGANVFKATMKLRAEDQRIKGQITDKKDILQINLISEEKISSDLQETPSSHNRADASLQLGGKQVAIAYGKLPCNGKAFTDLIASNQEADFVWAMGANRATKLMAGRDLKFGDTVIEAGSYSLWARWTGGKWHLLFNREADVATSGHNPQSDVAEVALELGKAQEPVDVLTLELEKVGDDGLFRLRWGTDFAQTKFSLAQ